MTVFGRKSAAVLVDAHERAGALGIPFCSAVVFFEALRALDPDHGVLSEDRLLKARQTIPPTVEKSDLDDMFAGAIERASQERHVVRPFDLLLAAAAVADPTLADCLAAVGDTLDGVVRRLTSLTAAADSTDESPPAMLPGEPRYAVVVQGPDFIDAANRYATFEDAQRACASLRRRAFGEDMPAFAPTASYVWILPPARIREATAVYIREL